MKALAVWAALAVAAVCAACGGGGQKVTGIGEPMFVQNAQFIEGPLPGTSPLAPGSESGDDGGTTPFEVTNLAYTSEFVTAGEQSKGLSGDVANDASAIGIQLQGMGSGYWVIPAGAPDGVLTGFMSFSFKANFSQDVPPGLRNVVVVGISPSGQAGRQSTIQLCFGSVTPDNDHSCFSDQPLPDTVFSLSWDTNFDVDLHVVMPDGTDINPKSPVAEPLEAGVFAVPEDDPHIDRDSIRNCVADGYRREDIIFQNPPPPGAYLIYADPFSPCGQAATRFTFTVYHPSGQCPTCTMEPYPSQTKSGELLSVQATGGQSTGLFVEQINF